MERMPTGEKEKLLDRQTNTILIWTLVLFPLSIAILVAFTIFVLSNKVY